MLTEILQHLNFASPTWVYALPLILMGIDILTGLVNACFKEKNFQSSVMHAGLTKKVGEIAILVIGELFSYGMRIPPVIMDGISAYIIFMEFMSIMENLKKMGVPIPGFIAKVLNTVDLALKEEDITEALKKVAELEKKIEELKK